MRKAGIAIYPLIVLLLIMLGGCERRQSATPVSQQRPVSQPRLISQPAEPISETRLMLDTICKITIYDKQDRNMLIEALDLCEEYEALLSISAEGGDVWRINHAGGAPVTVAPQTAEVISAGLEYGKLSDGMFDITIGRLSSLWDFTGQSGVPPESDLAFACETVDYRQVALNGNVVQLMNPETWIDLGGIAKGYIADKVADFLRERGVESAVIDLGGNIVVIGEKTDGNLWRVGVTKPFSERSDLIGVVETDEASVVSSGVYERQFVENGVLYHHILDPNTGMPVISDVIGSTVLSLSSMDGDALSTIVLLMGVNKPGVSSEGIERVGAILDSRTGFIGALLVLEDGEILQYGKIEFQEIIE